MSDYFFVYDVVDDPLRGVRRVRTYLPTVKSGVGWMIFGDRSNCQDGLRGAREVAVPLYKGGAKVTVVGNGTASVISK